MADEYRVIGPPGTGKTRYLSEQSKRAASVLGADRVLVCSLTKAAAREAAGRESGVVRQNIGTLHSLCYRMLGSPALVDGAMIGDWNREFPAMRITSSYGAASLEKGEALDLGDGPERGDELLQQLELVRAQCLPADAWSLELVGFADRWRSFKESHAAVDFTDLIDTAPDEPPTGTGAILVDEAQDHSLLEMQKLRAWAEHVKTFVVVGDPWQSLYSWRGADPDVFRGAPHRVLGQSWRVPRSVQECALGVIRRSGDWRDDIEYLPRDEYGIVEPTRATWRDPEPLLPLIEERGEDETIMILATCDYLLGPLKATLRNAGISYHNPYTHRWNPLSGSTTAKLMAMLRFSAHVFGGEEDAEFVWTLDELRRWAPLLLSAESLESEEGCLARGAKKKLESLPDGAGADVMREFVRENMTRRSVRALLEGDLAWIRSNLTKAAGTALEYPMAILERRGWLALSESPGVIIGTIHSVKGGEANHVVLFPDLSPSGWQQFQHPGWRARDAIYRTFYVGATRARNRLILARPASQRGNAVRW